VVNPDWGDLPIPKKSDARFYDEEVEERLVGCRVCELRTTILGLGMGREGRDSKGGGRGRTIE